MIVELFGVARLLAQTSEVPLALPPDAPLPSVFAALGEQLPVLVGRVITPDRSGLVAGYACNLNGREFIRSSSTRVQPGDHLLILAADAGG